MKKTISLISVFISVIVLLTTSVFADTRGKISGRVTDSETGRPLAGVNVYVAEQQIGSVSDINGNYNILNLPPGKHDVTASIIGYKKSIIQSVSVASDQTTVINFELQASVLQGEEVIVTAKKPLIQADRTSSKSVITEDDIKSLPTESFQGLLTTKAGVTQSSGGALHIRGGRSSEIVYMLDGIPITNPFSNGLGMSISTNMIKELSVVSGTFNAEYGKAMSGIVNLITKDGSDKIEGDVSFQFGDMYSNRTGIFDYVNEFNPMTFKRTDLSLSGPLKFLPGGSFILTGTFNNNVGWLYGKREHNPIDFYDFSGNDWYILMTGNGERVAMNPSVSRNVMGKVTIKPFKSSKLSYQFTGADNWHQNYNHIWKYNPDGRYNYTTSSYLHSLSFTHTLSNKTYYTVKASFKNADAEDYVHKLDVPYKWNEDINGNGVNDIMGYNTDGTPFDEDLNDDGVLSEITIDWDFLKKYGGFIPNPTHTITVFDSIQIDVPNYVRNDSRSDVPSYHFNYGGQQTGYFISNNQTATFKFDITSQVTNIHQLRSGIEFNYYELYKNNFYLEMSDRTNWEPYVQSIKTAGHDEYHRKPNDFSAYIQDKIETKSIIVQAGLRYDYFNAHDFSFSNKTDPINSDTIKATSKSQISPRLGVSFPITDQGYIHFSYGHFFQMPPFTYLYLNPNLKKSSGVTRFGNPDLSAQKTVMYELGLQQQLNSTTAIDVTIFYRDILNWLSSEYNYINDSFRYTKYITQDYG
ncbi:MAG: TonB-dependent receptor, partial [Bacteroidales bacterium]|nr:TonB-dependent receptor [Bacteroidales bacterium]